MLTKKTVAMLLVLASLTAIAGCATGYHSVKFSGGYSHTQLGRDAFSVTYSGNAFVGREKAIDFAILRAAELADQAGYGYFLIVRSSLDLSTYTTRTTYTTQQQWDGSYETTAQGGQQYDKPYAQLEIKCFEIPPETREQVYESEFVIRSIRSKYSLDDAQ